MKTAAVSPADPSLVPEGFDGLEAVRLENLGMTFGGAKALDDLEAVIPAGRLTGLVGPDASGKTTLLRILAGLMLPTEGRALVFGRPASDDHCRNSVGYMPQRFGLYEDLTVMANLRLHAGLRGLTEEAAKPLFEKLLAFTSLAPFTGRLASRLSGGMKQKLGIACALLGSPQILLLDEPGVGVDPRSRRELWRMVGELSGNGMTVIWATAYLDEAALCPDIIVLDAGGILWRGAPGDMIRQAEGRVFLLPGGESGKKKLARWITRPGVEDALIQGSRIRLLLARDAPAPLRGEALAVGGLATPPRLEDAYMSAVGGINQAPSPYGKESPAMHEADRVSPRIEVRNLTRKFGAFTAADNISFMVHPGEIFGLLGPNGAGKSTTFRMLCGLLKPTSGFCVVDGVDMLAAGGAARSRLGYMPQKFSLYPDISVRDNIILFAELYGLDKKRRESRAAMLTEVFGLGDYLRGRTSSLPLGQKQRLALLCATLHEPAAIFLDEPTSGVDARSRRDFWKHITAMAAAGASVLVTTHFMEEAEYCDRLALIYRGALISVGTPDDLKASCKTSGAGIAGPTLEEAFIAGIERYDTEHPL
ncbi:MAG: ATP-binding cassette domain-containing protein [Desulfovibrio sp.]|nr:ATP-binding cassette domain-containing protein [Desulfovibrio sp.]